MGKSYDDLVVYMEMEGKPRPSQIDQEKRNALVGWLENSKKEFLAIRS